MFNLNVNGFEIVARTLIIYACLLLALRVVGKREIGQMATFDLVVILLISNAVQNAMVGSDVSVTGGLIAAGVLIGANYGVATARDYVGVWASRPEYGKTVKSFDIYMAVLTDGVRTRDQFQAWLASRPQTE